jgi:hypothetical protein
VGLLVALWSRFCFPLRVLVAFGVVTEAQGIAVAPLVTLLASLAQNWRGTSA